MEAAKSDVFQIEEIVMARGRLKRKMSQHWFYTSRENILKICIVVTKILKVLKIETDFSTQNKCISFFMLLLNKSSLPAI